MSTIRDLLQVIVDEAQKAVVYEKEILRLREENEGLTARNTELRKVVAPPEPDAD